MVWIGPSRSMAGYAFDGRLHDMSSKNNTMIDLDRILFKEKYVS
jgi:hypothetical protein